MFPWNIPSDFTVIHLFLYVTWAIHLTGFENYSRRLILYSITGCPGRVYRRSCTDSKSVHSPWHVLTQRSPQSMDPLLYYLLAELPTAGMKPGYEGVPLCLEMGKTPP